MLERFSAALDADLLTRFDRFVLRRGYGNRSEAIRDLIRKALVDDEWQAGTEDVMGVITLVYDHHRPNLLNRLTELQHEARAAVISTTHVHMDHHNCLEIVIVRGRAGDVRALSDQLLALRGVKSGGLSTTTTGKRLA